MACISAPLAACDSPYGSKEALREAEGGEPQALSPSAQVHTAGACHTATVAPSPPLPSPPLPSPPLPSPPSVHPLQLSTNSFSHNQLNGVWSVLVCTSPQSAYNVLACLEMTSDTWSHGSIERQGLWYLCLHGRLTAENCPGGTVLRGTLMCDMSSKCHTHAPPHGGPAHLV